MAALGGRIVSRGGCLYVTGRGQPDRLAYFPREFGLATDRRGALIIRSRIDGKMIGRIGDEFTWGGPIALGKNAPMVSELRARCGNAPVEHVGMLTETSAFHRRYGRDPNRGYPPPPPPPKRG